PSGFAGSFGEFSRILRCGCVRLFCAVDRAGVFPERQRTGLADGNFHDLRRGLSHPSAWCSVAWALHRPLCGFSLAYSLSQALFGGFTPLICTWLIDVTKDKAIPGAWLSATALCGLAGLAALRARGTTGKDGAASTSASPACS